jgi:fumarate hydratase, class II
MTKQTKTHTDSMGPMEVPEGALYGAQTARAIENFPVSGWPMPREFIAALGLIKKCAAAVHKEQGRLEGAIADAIIAAAGEVADNKLDAHFPLDVFQTGSATSSNMNANEVIAHRAMQLLGDGTKVHPNDHVNMGQSSNDVIPTAIHVAAVVAANGQLMPALQSLENALAAKAKMFDSIVKIGRTHLMDAVPVRLGQEFAGYAAQMDHAACSVLLNVLTLSGQLPIGGTAVGTGLNAPAGFAKELCKKLSVEARVPCLETTNHFAAQGSKDAVVLASGALKSVAVSMGKIASDIRLLGSGPRCGIGELVLPATQPGSSIMPGKVNPVMCESVIQVCCQVIGCDAAITAGAMGGVGSILELNVAMPMMAWNLLTAIRLLANVARAFEAKCIRGLTADAARCEELVEQSLAMVTVLAPAIGYDAAAALAKEAHKTGKTIREICMEKKLLPEAKLDEVLDARRQTGP